MKQVLIKETERNDKHGVTHVDWLVPDKNVSSGQRFIGHSDEYNNGEIYVASGASVIRGLPCVILVKRQDLTRWFRAMAYIATMLVERPF